MLQGMRSFATILICGLSLAVSIVPAANAEDQVLPWPWDTACPFPWAEIEGAWEVEAPRTEVLPLPPRDEFQFKITYAAPDGTRYFNISRYNPSGVKIAEGSGQAPDYMKIIRAAMLEIDEDGHKGREGYWVFIRAYQENSVKDCFSDLTTVLTIRPWTMVREEDTHFILSKVEEDSSAQEVEEETTSSFE